MKKKCIEVLTPFINSVCNFQSFMNNINLGLPIYKNKLQGDTGKLKLFLMSFKHGYGKNYNKRRSSRGHDP